MNRREETADPVGPQYQSQWLHLVGREQRRNSGAFDGSGAGAPRLRGGTSCAGPAGTETQPMLALKTLDRLGFFLDYFGQGLYNNGMRLEFYHCPGTCSFVVHCALEHLGLDYESHPISIFRGQHRSAEYLALNPQGQVPLLIVDGRPIDQVLAQIEFLDRLAQGQLLPRDEPERSRAWSWLLWLNNTVQPQFQRLFRPASWTDGDPQAVKRVAEAGFRASLDRMERELVVPERLTVQDYYSIIVLRWAAMAGYQREQYPNLSAYSDRVHEDSVIVGTLTKEGLKIK